MYGVFFSPGDRLCKNVMKIQNRTWIGESPYFSLHDFLSEAFDVKKFLF